MLSHRTIVEGNQIKMALPFSYQALALHSRLSHWHWYLLSCLAVSSGLGHGQMLSHRTIVEGNQIKMALRFSYQALALHSRLSHWHWYLLSCLAVSSGLGHGQMLSHRTIVEGNQIKMALPFSYQALAPHSCLSHWHWYLLSCLAVSSGLGHGQMLSHRTIVEGNQIKMALPFSYQALAPLSCLSHWHWYLLSCLAVSSGLGHGQILSHRTIVEGNQIKMALPFSYQALALLSRLSHWHWYLLSCLAVSSGLGHGQMLSHRTIVEGNQIKMALPFSYQALALLSRLSHWHWYLPSCLAVSSGLGHGQMLSHRTIVEGNQIKMALPFSYQALAPLSCLSHWHWYLLSCLAVSSGLGHGQMLSHRTIVEGNQIKMALPFSYQALAPLSCLSHWHWYLLSCLAVSSGLGHGQMLSHRTIVEGNQIKMALPFSYQALAPLSCLSHWHWYLLSCLAVSSGLGHGQMLSHRTIVEGNQIKMALPFSYQALALLS